MTATRPLTRGVVALAGNLCVAFGLLAAFPKDPAPVVARGFATTVEALRDAVGGNVEGACRGDGASGTSVTLCRLFLGGEAGPAGSGRGAGLDARERALFQASGLAHLVAISGGQTTPIAALGAGLLLGLPAVLAGPRRVFRLLGVLRAAREAVFVALQLAAAFLYGASGALLRGPLLARPAAWLASVGVPRPASRAVFLCLLGAAIGNPFASPSFALSALGCECAVLAGRASFAYAAWEKRHGVACGTALIPRPLTTFLLGALLTTGAMTALTAPFFRGALLDALLANLLGVPLVGIVVTPLSLLALLAGALGAPTSFLSGAIAPALLASLAALEDLARAFATSLVDAGDAGAASFAFLRSAAGARYFALCLAVLWALDDATARDPGAELRAEFSRASRRTPPP